MSVDTETCKHQISYFGVTNINYNERTIGSVDIWRCAICKKRFCEEKQLGIDSIVDYVGMPKIDPDEKWGVLVRKLFKGKERWKLVRLKQNGTLKVENPDDKILDLPIKDFKVDDPNHASFLIDDYVNKIIEI
ncbi:MAG: hypothetical protein LV468_02145 [Candidatus Nitrosotenuis sp.]|jgi:hypothetical protein|uniref:hypothetical protein n=1 Tax=Candidatus Nitrosotenuis cloacae TaxID=1603555 RepID=UPI00227E3C43|nr:hypothetical protein [Candidatus Nitrosotenuis cloacae]MDC8437785.1 hypothetical protein [Candidatus Nitrosotenuis sp.]